MKFRIIKADYKSKYDCYFNGHKKTSSIISFSIKKIRRFSDSLSTIGKLPNIMLNSWLKALSVN